MLYTHPTDKMTTNTVRCPVCSKGNICRYIEAFMTVRETIMNGLTRYSETAKTEILEVDEDSNPEVYFRCSYCGTEYEDVELQLYNSPVIMFAAFRYENEEEEPIYVLLNNVVLNLDLVEFLGL